MLSLTVGSMLRFLSVANVRVCSSDTVAGGGVLGGFEVMVGESMEEFVEVLRWWEWLM